MLEQENFLCSRRPQTTNGVRFAFSHLDDFCALPVLWDHSNPLDAWNRRSVRAGHRTVDVFSPFGKGLDDRIRFRRKGHLAHARAGDISKGLAYAHEPPLARYSPHVSHRSGLSSSAFSKSPFTTVRFNFKPPLVAHLKTEKA